MKNFPFEYISGIPWISMSFTLRFPGMIRLEKMTNKVQLGDLVEAILFLDDGSPKALAMVPGWAPNPRWRDWLEQFIKSVECFRLYTKCWSLAGVTWLDWFTFFFHMSLHVIFCCVFIVRLAVVLLLCVSHCWDPFLGWRWTDCWEFPRQQQRDRLIQTIFRYPKESEWSFANGANGKHVQDFVA